MTSSVSYNQNLNVFLNYDFSHRHDHGMRLAVGKGDKPQTATLFAIAGNELKTIVLHMASFELEQVANFISKRQIVWLQECPIEEKAKLEYQLANLSKCVKEFNIKNPNKKIDFVSLATWELKVKLDFSRGFTENIQDRIVTKEVVFLAKFNKISLQMNILEKIDKVFNQNMGLRVRCKNKKCNHYHTITATAYSFFTTVIYVDKYLNHYNKYDFFWPIDKPGEDAEITLKITGAKNDFMQRQLDKIDKKCQTPKEEN